MNWNYAQIMNWFAESEHKRLMNSGVWGLEKEAHRVHANGELALTPHPAVFGDKLTNDRITVDFAESQLELITPPLQSISHTLRELDSIHDEVEHHLDEELLWPFSMPPRLPDEKQIPLATFDSTELGRSSEIYRKSLAVRYGTKMQMISGLHCNYSYPPELLYALYEQWGSGSRQNFINDLYMAAARNFLRYRWLLIYLFGASPVADESYQSVVDKELAIFKENCPECAAMLDESLSYATSLRVSRFGYSNTVQQTNVSFNSLKQYTDNIKELLKTPSEIFKHLGLYKNGEQIQLNEHILQKESEFYSSLRLKTHMLPGERHVDALVRHGVKYVEIRLMDINPFDRVGVTESQLHFLHLFMLFCLFHESPAISDEECETIHENHHRVSLLGRMPRLNLLTKDGNEQPLQRAAEDVFGYIRNIATQLDEKSGSTLYREVVDEEYAKVHDHEKLPSAKIVREMKDDSFIEYGTRMAKRYKGVACR